MYVDVSVRISVLCTCVNMYAYVIRLLGDILTAYAAHKRADIVCPKMMKDILSNSLLVEYMHSVGLQTYVPMLTAFTGSPRGMNVRNVLWYTHFAPLAHACAHTRRHTHIHLHKSNTYELTHRIQYILLCVFCRCMYWLRHGFIPFGESASIFLAPHTSTLFLIFVTIAAAAAPLLSSPTASSPIPTITAVSTTTATTATKRRQLRTVFANDASLLNYLSSLLQQSSMTAHPLDTTQYTDNTLYQQLSDTLTRSYFIPPSYRGQFAHAVAAYRRTEYDLCMAYLLPALEHCIRRAYVAVNQQALQELCNCTPGINSEYKQNAGVQLLMAQSTVLFTTFDHFLNPSVILPDSHTEISSELATTDSVDKSKYPNALWLDAHIGVQLMEALWDLLSSRDGVRLRDRIAHAEGTVHNTISSNNTQTNITSNLQSEQKNYNTIAYSTAFLPEPIVRHALAITVAIAHKLSPVPIAASTVQNSIHAATRCTQLVSHYHTCTHPFALICQSLHSLAQLYGTFPKSLACTIQTPSTPAIVALLHSKLPTIQLPTVTSDSTWQALCNSTMFAPLFTPSALLTSAQPQHSLLCSLAPSLCRIQTLITDATALITDEFNKLHALVQAEDARMMHT